MMERNLGSLQVATLLVSASYGIGFLFGSGELALTHGMAGSIYGVATGFGMLVLAVFAQRLWASGLPVWDLFGRAYGAQLQAAVALLSLIWMAGVLAAQIHGGVAVARLLGAADPFGHGTVLALIYGASRMQLRLASTVFALCLLASGLVLVYALVVSGGIGIYLQSVPTFLHDLPTFSGSRLLSISLAVSLLVCTGADYQQFVLAARRPKAAVSGCVLAGLLLFVIGFLPSAVVVAMQATQSLDELADGKQVVPWVLGNVAGSIGPGIEQLMLIALSVAALGSGAAILRAMSAALACAVPGSHSASHPGLAILALAIGAGLASREQGIVDTMVSVNTVYLASVGVCFVALLIGVAVQPSHARSIMGTGFAVSIGVYLAGWWGWMGEQADLVSLVAGCAASIVVALSLQMIARRRSRNVIESLNG
ncbi:MAG: hypothetical protein A2X72_22120 [Burkholderiales bacterium GWF1_66_17]|nr:MAG: hypothetical protein A2X73_06405 [Burkholderiales bacterium GWE1_65_30]OGA92651.1 MAG: hypothetical protein A2X72_22120 [Burkholderiales bacterium GWF1_66_17]